MKYSKPKGVFDIVLDSSWKSIEKWQYIEKVFAQTAKTYNYTEIRTPIFEKTDLFIRSVGEASDIVSKEMYTFLDKAERSMTLRPEGTASSIRAFIENRLDQNKHCQKLYYVGPYFRYDRPQAGRYRQFHQFGAEYIGVDHPEADAEMILFLYEYYQKIGLRNLTILLNCIGNGESRAKYVNALKDYLLPYKSDLSNDSQTRLEKNPLRILDSKDVNDQKLLQSAPSILDYLSPKENDHFERVKERLNGFNLPIQITPSLVRGLDYYNGTVFEITSDVLGAQNTIGAGGRYDNLIAQLGGPNFPACGFASGIERILYTLEGQKVSIGKLQGPFLCIIPMDETSNAKGFSIAQMLRAKNISCELYLRGKKLQKAMQFANDVNAVYTLVLGEKELTSNQYMIKEMKTGTQTSVKDEALTKFMMEKWGASEDI